MTTDEAKEMVAILLARQAELARFRLSLGPRDKQLLKTLLIKLGWWRSINMQRKKTQRLVHRRIR